MNAIKPSLSALWIVADRAGYRDLAGDLGSLAQFADKPNDFNAKLGALKNHYRGAVAVANATGHTSIALCITNELAVLEQAQPMAVKPEDRPS